MQRDTGSGQDRRHERSHRQLAGPSSRFAALARVARLALLALLLVPAFAASARAQVVPNGDWRTLRTPHFRVHYLPELDSLARRAAVSAERAWTRLAAELVAPRGPVDLVVADNVDYSNGFATTFPTNRIVVYAAPPIEGALRSYGDWMDLVVTHELAHVFHLDRTRGLWRVGQRVFGRNPALFPNSYQPSWLIEGIAVWYESRLTGSGRLAGTPHRVQALATASGASSPRLDQLSSATPAFPGGSGAYVWGSLAVEQLAGSDGAEMRRFIDVTASDLVPFRLNRAARRAFGASFSDAWRGWRDSVAIVARELRRDTTWRVVGRPAWDARGPRWRDDGRSVAWPASFARDVPALWVADSSGRLRRVARRNSLDVNVPRADGSVVFAQLDFVDPFRVRGDLWVERDGRRRRLTRGARLAQPDARDDGAIVAVQLVGGTTRLVRLEERDTRIVAVTAAHPDTQWSEPRWGGANGRAIAAVRRVRGGRSEVVRLDEGGRELVVTSSDRVEASPAWAGDGCSLWSVTDRGGVPVPVLAPAGCGTEGGAVRTLAGVAPGTAGVLALDQRGPGADGTPGGRGDALAALAVGTRGYMLLLRDADTSAMLDTIAARGDSLGAARQALADTAGQGAALGASRGYSPWRMLRPTWWLPLMGETDEGVRTLGAYSSGSDILGRHLWSAELSVPLERASEWEGAVAWRWRGLGQPAIDVSVLQEWDRFVLLDAQRAPVGRYARRDHVVALGATVVRPRIYSGMSLSTGLEYEWNDPVATDPPELFARLNPVLRQSVGYPGAYVAGAWSRLERAPLATGPENGFSIGASLRHRWQGALELEDGALDDGRTAIGVLRLFRALPLPGYAKHVLAARVSGAWANDASLTDFTAGGVSGSSLELLPGVTVGDASRAFGVRGFAGGTLSGNRALGTSLEYRAPLLLANRGLGLLPLYLARTGVTLFGEGAAAWCEVSAPQPVCPGGYSPRTWIASTGAELWLDASATYDVPYRLRLGVAVPARERALATREAASVYVTFGAAF